jgi:Asp-tRNA(Asn)/Glu-tRNA(Gln) amidotransferase A subunit family amidase
MADKSKAKDLDFELSKRDFLKLTGAAFAYAAALSTLPSVAFGSQTKSLSHDEIIRMNLIDGIDALKSGKISSVQYNMAALAQAVKFKGYNIFTQISPFYVQTTASAIDKKRGAGEKVGPLEGIPYALKDSVDMLEYYTISGHPALKYFEPKVDADLVKILKEAHAVCIGKTQLPVLSLWWTTENPMTGDTGNPFNKAYKTGGSSGGSGAAVAARIVPFAVAEDTGGSIRVPAAMNGVQGFRPTTGRWPTAGTMPIGFSDTLGPITRSVADIKLLDSLCATDHPKHETSKLALSQLRIGYQKSVFLDGLHPWVQENLDQTMETLSKAGVTLVEVHGMPAKESHDITLGILLADFPGAVARYFNRHGVYDKSGFGLMHKLNMDTFKKAWMPGMNNSAYGENYFTLVEKLMELRKAYNKIMTENKIDVLMYPTSKVPNTPNDGGDMIVTKGPLGKMLSELDIGANMFFSPAQKTPSVAMFSGLDKAGLPLSVTFDGYSGQDRKVLDIAEAIEKVLPPLAEPTSI